MDIEVCHIPFEPHGWIQPPPTAASWRALLPLGVTGVRLNFNYNDSRWWEGALMEAVRGGMRITGNFCAADVSGSPPADLESTAFRWMMMNGNLMRRVSFGNEPGYAVGADGIPAYVQNFFAPFVRGVLRASPTAIIGGCDAESADTQRQFIDGADSLLMDIPTKSTNLCDIEFIHPYGDVGDLDYATSRAFADAREVSTVKRPWGISELDHQQLPSAKQRRDDVKAARLAAGDSEAQAQLAGDLARLKPTDDEIRALIGELRFIVNEYPDCACFTLGFPGYFFEDVTVGALTYSSFYTSAPIVSEVGKEFVAAIAEINGPAPVATGGHRTMGRRG